MQRPIETGNGFVGTIVWMVLLILLTFSMPQKASHSKRLTTPAPVRMEMSQLTTQAISAEAVVMPSALNSCLKLVAVPVYSLYCKILKVAADNRLTLNNQTWLRQLSQRLRPLLLERWSPYQCVTYCSEDPSLLS